MPLRAHRQYFMVKVSQRTQKQDANSKNKNVFNSNKNKEYRKCYVAVMNIPQNLAT